MSTPRGAPRGARTAIEREHCAFRVQRDGIAAAIESAQRTVRIYRQAVFRGHACRRTALALPLLANARRSP